MRTGRSVLLLSGHVKALLSIDFSPNGYHVATGSEDHSARVGTVLQPSSTGRKWGKEPLGA